MNEIIVGAEPFYLQGKNKAGVLCLHGFTGTPWDFRELGSFLNVSGFSVSVPLLAGHGTCAKDLAKTRWQQWYRSAEDAYKKLSKSCEKVYIVGISAGFNLGVLLANMNEVAGIISIGGNLVIRPKYNFALAVAPYIKYIYPFFKKTYQEHRLDEAVRIKRVNYPVIPLANAADLTNLTKASRIAIETIACSVHALVSKTDHVVSKKTQDILIKYLGNRFTQKEFDNGYHVLIVDSKVKNDAFREILSFIGKNE